MAKGKTGDIVVLNISGLDLTKGKRYFVFKGSETSHYATVADDAGDEHDLYDGQYTVIGDINSAEFPEASHLIDSQGVEVFEGDCIAYTYGVDNINVFTVTRIIKSQNMAYCEDKRGNEHLLGVFYKRAVKLESPL